MLYLSRTLDQRDKSAHSHWLQIRLSQGACTTDKQVICLYTLYFVPYKHMLSLTFLHRKACFAEYWRSKNVMMIHDSHCQLYYLPRMPHVHKYHGTWPSFSKDKLVADMSSHSLTLETIPRRSYSKTALAVKHVKQGDL